MPPRRHGRLCVKVPELAHVYPMAGISVLDVSRTFDDATVVFGSDRDMEGRPLWRMNADGSASMPVSQHRGQDASVRWSPDGRQLACVSTRDGRPRIDISGEFAQRVKCMESTTPPSAISNHCLDWSPDGAQIAFIDADHQKINLVNVQTGATTTLLNGAVEDNYDYHVSVSWNHATDTIVFSTRNSAKVENYHDVFTLNPRDGVVTRLTDHRSTDYYLGTPVVSPDGTTIAAVHFLRSDDSPPHGLWILQNNGTRLAKLDETSAHFAAYPTGPLTARTCTTPHRPCPTISGTCSEFL